MIDVVVVEAVRSPIGKRNGGLAGVHPVDLSADVLNALIDRSGLDPALVDDVIWGCVAQVGDQSANIARYAVLAAGWPESVPGTTVNRACGSSQQAIDFGATAIMSGHQEIVVAGGVEVMSRVPLGAARVNGVPFGPRATARYGGFDFNQGLSAELIATRWGLSRQMLDEYAARSHERSAAAIDAGSFEEQIVTIATAHGDVSLDEGIRRGTTPERLAALSPAFRDDGVVHAGNASQISDGAAALLMMSSDRARDLGLEPLAYYRAGVVIGDDPVLMLTGPVAATARLLKRTGLSIGDIGAFEVNEAFATVPLMWLAETGADPAATNPLGGAIALGHPLGASGAVLMTRLIHHLRADGIRYGLQTMCEGGGTANATLIELA